MKVKEIKTEEEFKELVFDYENEVEWKFKGDKNTLLDFYSDSCMPCKMVIGALEEAPDDDRFDIYKINAETLPAIATMLSVKNVPTLMFISSDKLKEPEINVGALPTKKIINLLETI